MWEFLDKLTDAIVVFDDSKNVKYVNAAAKNTLGVDRGSSILDILKEDDKTVFLDNVMKLADKGESYSNFMRFLNKDKGLIFCWLNVFKWNNDYVFEIFDLSPVDARAEGITDSSYVKILKYMSVGISHSIRNPIMSAGGMLSRIKAKINDIDGRDAEKLIKYIEIVEKSLYRIISIIANIEVVSNSLPVKLQRVSVADAVRSVVERYKDKAEFVLDMNKAYVYADEMHIGFVVEEIVKNALDAIEGQDDGRITIKVFESGRFVFIEIEDNGRGMSKEELSLTTIPFYSTKPSNMGIGLSLAKFIIEGYHGKISIESEKGKGTKVTIAIPSEKRSDIRIKRLYG